MQKKFTVLRVVSTIFKILAWIILVIGVLGACGMIALGAMSGSSVGTSNSFGNNPLVPGAGGAIGGAIVGVGLIIGALHYFLVIYAFGDILTLLISLEENTRLTAERLMQPLPPVSPKLAPLPPIGNPPPPVS